MWVSGFPVEGGVAESLTKPGKNVTGLTIYAGGEVFGKLVQLVHQAKPGVRRIGGFMGYVPPFHPAAGGPDVVTGGMRSAAAPLGLDLRIFEIAKPEHVDDALAWVTAQRIQALVLTSDPPLLRRASDITRFAIAKRLPTIADAAWPFVDAAFAVVRGLLRCPDASGRALCEQNLVGGRQTGRAGNPVALQVRVRGEPQDREGDRSDNPAVTPAAGGPGDRVKPRARPTRPTPACGCRVRRVLHALVRPCAARSRGLGCDSWSGIGRVAVGMPHQGYDLQLTQYDERGWRATFYTHRDGALTDQRDRHRMGENTVACGAKGGDGRR